MAKVLYVAGYGRSGSTVLDVVLGSHTEITGLGELSLIRDELTAEGRRCACGELYGDCQLWGPMARGIEDDPDVESIRRVEKRSRVLRLLLGWLPKSDRTAYRDYHTRLWNHLERHAPEGRLLVDSSKSARYTLGRFLALRKICGDDVRVVHLVRSGSSVMESVVLRGSNWAQEGYTKAPRLPGLRALVGWTSTNIWVSVLGRLLGSERYLMLRFEDLLKDPSGQLERIGAFAGFDPGCLLARLENGARFETDHQMGGNRVRKNKSIVLGQVDVGRGSGSKLSTAHRAAFALFGGWLNRAYGY